LRNSSEQSMLLVMSLALFTPLLLATMATKLTSSASPNIFFLLIDDLGWNDLSLHGGCDYATPNLDALANGGLQLNNYYTQHLCSPSRHALMSGRYPISDGMQEHSINMAAPYGMPLYLKTLPQMLQSVGYKTHMIGKWHLGFCKEAYTPTMRGFDSFLGFYGDAENYYTKIKNDEYVNLEGVDFRRDLAAYTNCAYSSYLYGNESLRVLREHVLRDSDAPFFFYFSSQAVHTPWDAPRSLLDRFPSIDGARRELAAVTTALDDTVGLIVEFMKSAESGYLWENTLFVVSSDNGAPINEGASNFPLRGSKATLWEGGIKATAWVTGGALPEHRRGRSMDALMHISDWFPSLCSLAGVDYEAEGIQPLDGVDQIDNIVSGETDIYWPRDTLVHNIDSAESDPEGFEFVPGAIRWRKYKIQGYRFEESASADTKCEMAWCPLPNERSEATADSMSIQCAERGNLNFPAFDFETDCPYNGFPCLFDIEADPCEYFDLREREPEVFRKMVGLLTKYNATQRLPTLYSEHPEEDSNAALRRGFWFSWLDEKWLEEKAVYVEVEGEGMSVSRVMDGDLISIVVIVVMVSFAMKMLYDFWTRQGLHGHSYKAISGELSGGTDSERA